MPTEIWRYPLEDATAEYRRKGRFIVGIRYPPAPRLFDRRGQIISDLHSELEDEFPHWRTNKSKIHFVDDLEDPTAEFLFTHLRASVILEQPVEIDDFLERADRYLEMFYATLGEDISEVDRCGVRIIEILTSDDVGSYEAANRRLITRFMPGLPGDDLDYVDSSLKAVHEHGFYQIGPAGEGEEWVSQAFSRPEEFVPEYGFGLDVDSNRKELVVRSGDELVEAYRAVAALTKRVEEEVAERVLQP